MNYYTTMFGILLVGIVGINVGGYIKHNSAAESNKKLIAECEKPKQIDKCFIAAEPE